jgi:hypothetical protein
MAHLTNAQATELVDNGSCELRVTDGVYTFHKFRGRLEGEYYELQTPTEADLALTETSYELQTPTEADLALTETSTEAECKAAFIAWFENNCDYKGTAPVQEDSNVW